MKLEKLTAPRVLRAGPLSLEYRAGQVRNVRVGQVEVVRGIYGAVRDRDWNTVPLQVLAQSIEQGAEGFRVWFEARHRAEGIAFSWRGEIVGGNGTLRFGFEGQAQSRFWRNRIGLCVLHPLEAAGSRARAWHWDGSEQAGALPLLIAPRCPFEDIAAFEHQARAGLWARLDFWGETFEMEDQRNWSDASFKTYGTPLSLPFPVQIGAGVRVSQAITLSLRRESASGPAPSPAVSSMAQTPWRFAGPSPQASLAPPANQLVPDWEASTTLPSNAPARLSFPDAAAVSDSVRVQVGASAVCKLAPLGLAWHDAAGVDLSAGELEALRLLQPAHLRVGLRLSDCLSDCLSDSRASRMWTGRLGRALSLARDLGAGLEIALTLSGEDELEALAASCGQVLAGAPIAHWLLLDAGLGAVAPEIVRSARDRLARFDTGAAFGSGSDANFAELNRARPSIEALGALDFLSFASNPQVHAFDDASLFETCRTLPSMIASARGFAQGRGVALSPLSLKPRFNAVATSSTNQASADEPGAPQVLAHPEALLEQAPSNSDARQFTLLGAAWALSSLAALAPCGLHHATLFETMGWRGVLALFAATSPPLFAATSPPLFHVLAAANALANADVLPASCSSPERACALALRDGARTRVLLANTTAKPLQLELRLDLWGGAAPQAARVAMLDESSVEAASHEPRFFCERGGAWHTLTNGALSLTLGAYVVARVDFEHSAPAAILEG